MNDEVKNPIERLRNSGWEIESFAGGEDILQQNFELKMEEITEILLDFKISVQEIMCEGGGLHPITKKMRSLFTKTLEKEVTFQTKRVTYIPPKKKSKDKDERIISTKDEEESHSVDFFFKGKKGNFALETEWNSKVLAHERDIANFSRLFFHSAISVGITITRSASLEDALPLIVKDFLKPRIKSKNWKKDISAIKEELSYFKDVNNKPLKFKDFTNRQQDLIDGYIKDGMKPHEAVARNYVADKWSGQTTELSSGATRINRGGFEGVPILLVGLPNTIVE